MKQLFSLLLVFTLLLGTAWATGGDPNLEGGGGETGTGTGTNRWFSGNDGIRVSIMQGTTAIKTFDLANRDWKDTVERCFTKKDKLTYPNYTLSKRKQSRIPFSAPQIFIGHNSTQN